MQIDCLILAAGLSRRMGRPKQLLPWNKNATVLSHVVEQACSADYARAYVITGHERDAVEKQVAHLPATPIYNPDYAIGEMVCSLQAGLRVAILGGADGVAVMLGDLPLVTADIHNHLIHSYTDGRIVIPTHEKKQGHPVLFASCFFDRLLNLEMDKMPSAVIRSHLDAVDFIAIPSPAIYQDMDTAEAYETLLKRDGY